VVGLDVQPEDDLLNVDFADTLTLQTRTMRLDSIRTDEDFVIGSSALLGKYSDPVFGVTSSSIFTQLRLTANISPTSFGASPVCDSIVLIMVYDGALSSYGKTPRKKQTINVYQLNEGLKRDGIYYSDTTLAYMPNDLASAYQFTPAPADSVYVGTTKLKPQLRVPLDKVLFGQNILNNQTTGMLVDNETFQEDFIKGLYITTSTTSINNGTGNITRFKMDESKVTVYYHNATETGKSFDMSLGSVARFQSFSHATTGLFAPLATQYTTSTQQNEMVFIQGMSGAKVFIGTPYLMSLIDSGAISINKAELVIKAYAQGNGGNGNQTKAGIIGNPFSSTIFQLETYAPPAKLILAGINANGTGYDLPDAQEGSNYYGGNYNATTKEYRFNIARYIQQVLDGTRENNGLYLVIPPLSSNAYPNRIVIGGGAAGDYQMKMNITYTKLQ
jgi:hypothetical protein